MRNCYEVQTVPKDGRYWYAVTITNDQSQWTSPLAPLAATTSEAASAEAAGRTRAFIGLLEA